mmetsp:Transcript_141421/g.271356  ORF Transcript_141421/g.271356 Transcript_141421/m.271356 type:complete len:421 (-) Transcript_141421:848-2110(-)
MLQPRIWRSLDPWWPVVLHGQLAQAAPCPPHRRSAVAQPMAPRGPQHAAQRLLVLPRLICTQARVGLAPNPARAGLSCLWGPPAFSEAQDGGAPPDGDFPVALQTLPVHRQLPSPVWRSGGVPTAKSSHPLLLHRHLRHRLPRRRCQAYHPALAARRRELQPLQDRQLLAQALLQHRLAGWPMGAYCLLPLHRLRHHFARRRHWQRHWHEVLGLRMRSQVKGLELGTRQPLRHPPRVRRPAAVSPAPGSAMGPRSSQPQPCPGECLHSSPPHRLPIATCQREAESPHCSMNVRNSLGVMVLAGLWCETWGRRQQPQRRCLQKLAGCREPDHLLLPQRLPHNATPSAHCCQQQDLHHPPPHPPRGWQLRPLAPHLQRRSWRPQLHLPLQPLRWLPQHSMLHRCHDHLQPQRLPDLVRLGAH